MYAVFAQEKVTKAVEIMGKVVEVRSTTPAVEAAMKIAGEEFGNAKVKITNLPFGVMSSDMDNDNAKRYLAVKNDIYCMFQGTLDNAQVLREKYNMTDEYSNEADLLTRDYFELHKTRDNNTPDRKLWEELASKMDLWVGGVEWYKSVSQLQGSFFFIIFDAKADSFFALSKAPNRLFWGCDNLKNVFISTNDELVTRMSHTYGGPIPTGYFVQTARGLRSLEKEVSELTLKELPESMLKELL